jgi:hypothetical protein
MTTISTTITNTYRECGRRAAQAMNVRNGSQFAFERNWLANALAHETPDYRALAQAAFNAAYRAARKV